VVTRLPKIFSVNWFRRGGDGKFLWPGFGDNIRVLKWIIEQTDESTASSRASPIGFLPQDGALDTSSLDISSDALSQLLSTGTPKQVCLWSKQVHLNALQY
jgi:phosphoenolpyruvate carboxykinase (GTP)